MEHEFLIYGAYGYTGALIAEEAARRGMPAILAGRDPVRLAERSAVLGFDYRVFGLDDVRLIRENIRDVRAVLHCAGPFVHTADPMVRACLESGVHYLDITGEIGVFERLAALDEEASRAGVMLLPGAGLDVVPSDCLAAHLARRLPSATRLAIALQTSTTPSHGTTVTVIEHLGDGGSVRVGGRIVRVPYAHKTRSVDFGRGPSPVVSFPLGDVSTAFHSTGIPDIETFIHAGPGLVRALRAGRGVRWLLGWPWVKRLLRSRVAAGGPDADARRRGRCLFWAQVSDAEGGSLEACLTTPEGYAFTVQSALHLVGKVLEGDAPLGFHTPSSAYGADLVLEIDGVEGFTDGAAHRGALAVSG